MVLPTKQVRADMQRNGLPVFEMRHRMALALEYGSVSVNDIANELGISRTTVSNYLHGRTVPRRAHLIAWAMRCGVPFEWLVGAEPYEEICAHPLAAQPTATAPAKAPVVKVTKASLNGSTRKAPAKKAPAKKAAAGRR